MKMPGLPPPGEAIQVDGYVDLSALQQSGDIQVGVLRGVDQFVEMLRHPGPHRTHRDP